MRHFTFVILALVLAVALPTAAAADWQSFVIRNGSTSGNAPVINNLGGGVLEFVIAEGGQKAGLGTNALNGHKIGEISKIFIQRVDDYTRFTTGSGPYVAPYFNIWVTNGSGKYAVAANEPSDAEWTGLARWDMDWDILKTKAVKFYENNDKSWLPNNGVGLTFQDISHLLIQAPSVAELNTGWTGLGTGAPRELGTNVAYGFNWVFGDTLSNYVSGDPGYRVANPYVAAIPEPVFFQMGALMGLSGLGLLRLRRKA